MPPQSLMLVNGGGEVAGLDEKLHNGGGELVDLDSAVVVAVLRGDMGVDLVCYSELGSTSYRGCPRARQPSRSSCSSIEMVQLLEVICSPDGIVRTQLRRLGHSLVRVLFLELFFRKT
ncbi:uncharacterized protein LOC125518348 isoform X3 [Triticum urartu]|uniref:uncharacterized protein LOC125518348 isoform X3 n=1 Tax=Triticum urartu TaxID=4572 RepID=UPI002042D3A5|nr:uncharacterized protein LOC125518348 isoform X3 [Triticum urartu]